MKFSWLITLIICSAQISAQEMADTLGNFVEGKEDTTTITVLRLKINSDKSDFSPVFNNKELIFVSGRNREIAVDYVDSEGESEITDLYRCEVVQPEKFKSVKPFDNRLNTKYYEGPFCMNKQGSVIYFTGTDKRSPRLKIYWSEKNSDKWSKPEQLSFCTDTFSYFHPALSPDEQTLVFCSNRNAENRVDLFESKWRDDSWSEPRPLNKLINDTNNQVFPFISQNNTLYFSCDKKNGSGLDIYSVCLDSAGKSPRLLDAPINSRFDDFGVWVDSSSTSGYFSSNRVKKFKDDIYYFTNSMPDFRNAKTIVPKSHCYSFVEESTMDSRDTLNLTYEWDFGDGKKSRGLHARHCFKVHGEYNVMLNVVDKVSGEVRVSQTSYPLLIERPNQMIIECSPEVFVNEEFSLLTKDPYLKDCKLEKICWSFGDGWYNSGSSVMHIYKKPGVYTIQLGVVARSRKTNLIELYKTEKMITVRERLNKNFK